MCASQSPDGAPKGAPNGLSNESPCGARGLTKWLVATASVAPIDSPDKRGPSRRCSRPADIRRLRSVLRIRCRRAPPHASTPRQRYPSLRPKRPRQMCPEDCRCPVGATPQNRQRWNGGEKRPATANTHPWRGTDSRTDLRGLDGCRDRLPAQHQRGDDKGAHSRSPEKAQSTATEPSGAVDDVRHAGIELRC